MWIGPKKKKAKEGGGRDGQVDGVVQKTSVQSVVVFRRNYKGHMT